MLETLKQFNWIDVFLLLFFLRVLSISRKSGLPAEIFKFLGIALSIYLSFHYYLTLSVSFLRLVNLEFIPVEFVDFFSFLLLAFLSYWLFIMLRKAFSRFINMEASPVIAEWGGLIIGIFRGILASSLLIFMLYLTNLNYLKSSVESSYLGRRIYNVAPAAYRGIWNAVMSKFMGYEEINSNIPQIEENLKNKNHKAQ